MTSVAFHGIVCPGYGIASKGSAKTQNLVSNIYEDRRIVTVDQTVFRQFPFFVEAGVPDIENMHPGTINVDISPHEFYIAAPDHEVTCEWIDGVRETFWLTATTLSFNNHEYNAYIYYPCVSEQHVARNSIVEIIAEHIGGIEYGVSVELILDIEKTPVTLS
jgi:hypothetical protein